MTEPVAGGRRRVDRVLDEQFVLGLEALTLRELRERRHEAEQEDADLSYIRRLLQGRMDIVRAEQTRRVPTAADGAALVDQLSEVLADGPRPAAHGSGRFLTVEPSRVAENRRVVEQIVSDPLVSDVESRSDADLVTTYESLARHERVVSDVRHRVQKVMDTLTAEVARRYREGEASVDELLPGSREP